MSKLNQVSEDIRKLAIEKVAHVKIYQLSLIVEIINLASTRGAFRGEELSHVGTIYDNLISGINKSIELAKEDLEKVSEVKNNVVEEEEEEVVDNRKK